MTTTIPEFTVRVEDLDKRPPEIKDLLDGDATDVLRALQGISENDVLGDTTTIQISEMHRGFIATLLLVNFFTNEHLTRQAVIKCLHNEGDFSKTTTEVTNQVQFAFEGIAPHFYWQHEHVFAMQPIVGAPVQGIQQQLVETSHSLRLLLMKDILDMLTIMHARGKSHGDVKPGNVLVDTEGKSKLIDFGSTHSFSLGALHQGAPTTLVYAAPEQISTIAHPNVDVFGVGNMLYALSSPRWQRPMNEDVISALGRQDEGSQERAIAHMQPPVAEKWIRKRMKESRIRDLLLTMLHPLPDARASVQQACDAVNKLFELFQNEEPAVDNSHFGLMVQAVLDGTKADLTHLLPEKKERTGWWPGWKNFLMLRWRS